MGSLTYPSNPISIIKGELSWNNEADLSTIDVTTTLAGTFYNIKEAAKPLHEISISGGLLASPLDVTFTVPKSQSYQVSNHVSMASGTTNTVTHLCFFVNDVEQDAGCAERKISVSGDVGAAGHTTYLDLKKNDVVDIRIKTDKAGAVISFEHITFIIEGKG